MRIAETRGESLSAMVAAVDAAHDSDRSLASALRVMALVAERAQCEVDPIGWTGIGVT